MKKNELLKIIGIFFFAVLILTWIIPIGGYSTGSFVLGKTSPLGIVDLVRTPLIAVANLLQYGLLFMAIGAVYGVANATGVYSRIVNKIASNIQNKKLFLSFVIGSFACITSLIGLNYGLFVIVPFIAAIMLKNGISKTVTLLSTVGAILIGNIGATFSYDVAGSINTYLGTNFSNMILWKVVILLGITALYIFTILGMIPEKKSGKTKNQVEGEIPLLEDIDNEKKSTIPFAIISIFSILIILVGLFNWQDVLKVEFFYNAYEKINNIAINNYPILKNIIGNITPLGYWGVYELIIFLVMISFVIGWIYSLKIDDIIDSMRRGIKVTLPAAFYVSIASLVFAIMFSTQSGDNIFYTIYNFVLSLSSKFSIFTTALGTIFGGLLYNDFTGFVSAVATPLLSYEQADLMPLMGIITSSIYGLVMLVAPTCIILVGGLSLYSVSYIDWIKSLWKFLCFALAGLLALSLIISLIIV